MVHPPKPGITPWEVSLLTHRVGISQHTWVMLGSPPPPPPTLLSWGICPEEGKNWGLILLGNVVLWSWILPLLR